MKSHTPILVIHGGAGVLDKSKYPPERQIAYRNALKGALQAGTAVLANGGSALDAVERAVMFMEDCPLFNCARGAVYNIGGTQELEASIMVSAPPSSDIPVSRRGASVTLINKVKNPISLAKALYLDPKAAPHFFLSGQDAERIANEKGLPLKDVDYFYTEARWKEHLRGIGSDENTPFPKHHGIQIESDDEKYLPEYSRGEWPKEWNEKGDPYSNSFDDLPKGTVGAVALDSNGVVACATSTGGKTNKNVGRIGDTPHCGSGFWSSTWKSSKLFSLSSSLIGIISFLRFGRNESNHRSKNGKWKAVALSGTGDGDYFIRQNTCHEIESRMRLQNQSLKKASNQVIKELKFMGGSGGVIGVDLNGKECFAINSTGMFRGFQRLDGSKPKVAIFSDEELSE